MTTGRNKSIKALVDGCRRGSKDDWAELINRLSPVVFSVCRRYRMSREESFDIFGKVSLLLLENLDRLRDAERVFGYVSKMASREAMAMRSRAKLFAQSMDECPPSRATLRHIADGRIGVETDEELEMVARAFAGLSEKCRELLTMLFLESASASYKEISQRLGIPVSSIGPTRGRCLRQLRQYMKKQGYTE